MPDFRKQDAALGAATTVWDRSTAIVLPLTVAMAAIQGARWSAAWRKGPYAQPQSGVER